MAFLDRKSRVVDIVLTGRGRELFARGELDFAHYAFFDDGLDYDPWSTGSLSDEERDVLIHSSPMFEAAVIPDRRSDVIPLEPTSFLFRADPNYGTVPRLLQPSPTGSQVSLRCDQFSSGSAFIRTGTSLAVVPLEVSAEASPEGFSVHVFTSGSNGLAELHTRMDLRGRVTLDPFLAISVDDQAPQDRPSVKDPSSERRGGR